MEMESYISLSGTIILLALFEQRCIFGQRYISRRKYTPVYGKDTKQTQNNPMETTRINERNGTLNKTLN